MDVCSFCNVDVVIIKGDWGVVENGVIWVLQEQLFVCVFFFIIQYFIFLLLIDKIVEIMYDVYYYIWLDIIFFGVFIVGFFKIVDIE